VVDRIETKFREDRRNGIDGREMAQVERLAADSRISRCFRRAPTSTHLARAGYPLVWTRFFDASRRLPGREVHLHVRHRIRPRPSSNAGNTPKVYQQRRWTGPMTMITMYQKRQSRRIATAMQGTGERVSLIRYNHARRIRAGFSFVWSR
jgi:hypothetical protein